MIYIDLNDKTAYNDILLYIFQICDEVSFHFPIFDEEKFNKFPDLSKDYIRYENRKKELLPEFFKHGAKQEIRNIYQGIKLGYDTRIIRVKLYPQLIEFIQKNHLYDWVWWNALPEDPCFFCKKECRFITISHEELFYVCDKKKDSSLIKKIYP